MNWYRELTLGRRILAGFLVVACLAGISGVGAALGIREVSTRGELMYTGNVVQISDLTEVVKGYQTSLYLLRDIVIDKSAQEQNDHLEKLKQSDERVAKGLAAFFASNRSREAAALQQGMGEDLKLYLYFRDKIVELAGTDRRDEAINIMRTQASDVTDRIDAGIAKIIVLNKAEAARRYAENVAAARFVLVAAMICLCIGVAAALVIGYFISRSITSPLTAIAGRVAAIAEGDLTARIGGGGRGGRGNELDVLSRHVDRMAETLQQMVARIASDSGELTLASGNLNAVSETIAKRAVLSSDEIYAVAGSSAEMSATASEIARNCATAADNVSRANGAVALGLKTMGDTITTMRGIGAHARETSEVISRLGAQSLQIGEITATIEDIADQTNLLALNAAIEAARAGDHGRGFAVVADEVRALASRTSKATREISQMIKSVQHETATVVAAMEKGVAEAESGIRKADETGAALEAITETIRSISEEVSHIATAAEEQSSTVHTMTGNLQRVTAVIKENEEGSRDFLSAAAGLNIMATGLKQVVSGFKIEADGTAVA